MVCYLSLSPLLLAPPGSYVEEVIGALHFQVHPCGVLELLVDSLPEGASLNGALYPDSGHIKDLKEVRDLLYKMQRPAIAPSVRVILLRSSSLY